MITRLLGNPVFVFAFIFLISFSALAAAFIAEALFLLEPCKLCIYQRYPFALGLLVGIFGIIFRKNTRVITILLSLCALGFLVNSGTAVYHTGVEQHWWESAVDGCEVHFEDTSSQSILDNILSAPMGNCSVIPWQDPVLGLSMANYNILFCFGLFIFCLLSLCAIRKRTHVHHTDEDIKEE